MTNVTQETSYWLLIAYVVAAYLVYRAVVWIWFRYVDWRIAREVVRRRLFEGTRRRQPGQPGAPH